MRTGFHLGPHHHHWPLAEWPLGFFAALARLIFRASIATLAWAAFAALLYFHMVINAPSSVP